MAPLIGHLPPCGSCQVRRYTSANHTEEHAYERRSCPEAEGRGLPRHCKASDMSQKVPSFAQGRKNLTEDFSPRGFVLPAWKGAAVLAAALRSFLLWSFMAFAIVFASSLRAQASDKRDNHSRTFPKWTGTCEWLWDEEKEFVEVSKGHRGPNYLMEETGLRGTTSLAAIRSLFSSKSAIAGSCFRKASNSSSRVG